MQNLYTPADAPNIQAIVRLGELLQDEERLRHYRYYVKSPKTKIALTKLITILVEVRKSYSVVKMV